MYNVSSSLPCRRAHDARALSSSATTSVATAASHKQLHANVLSILLRACLSQEQGIPPAQQRIQQLHSAGLLSMADLLDVCAIFAASNRAHCVAIAQACWAAVDLAGVSFRVMARTCHGGAKSFNQAMKCSNRHLSFLPDLQPRIVLYQLHVLASSLQQSLGLP